MPDTWNGTTGNWIDETSWSDGAVPTAGDVAEINAGTVTATDVNTKFVAISLDATANRDAATLNLDNTNLSPVSLLLLSGVNTYTTVNLDNANLGGIVLAQRGGNSLTVEAGTSTINTGLIESAATSTAGVGLGIDDDGGFTNAGVIDASGTGSGVGINFGRDPSSYQTVSNTGIIEAQAGAQASFNALQLIDQGTYGGVLNSGQIDAKGGSVYINANITQTACGSMRITQGGTITLGGETDGGVIKIQSGMLNFAPPDLVPTAQLKSSVDFTGPSGSISFAQAVASETFRLGTNDILVNNFLGGHIADVQLAGTGYSANEFSLSGNTLVYTADHSV